MVGGILNFREIKGTPCSEVIYAPWNANILRICTIIQDYVIICNISIRAVHTNIVHLGHML